MRHPWGKSPARAGALEINREGAICNALPDRGVGAWWGRRVAGTESVRSLHGLMLAQLDIACRFAVPK